MYIFKNGANNDLRKICEAFNKKYALLYNTVPILEIYPNIKRYQPDKKEMAFRQQ